MKKELINQEQYEALIEDCKAIVVETIFNSRWALVEGYWKLGERVEKDKDFKRFAKGNKDACKTLARNLGISDRTLYYAMQVYRKYPELGKIPDGKNISWNKLITLYLPAPKEDPTPPLPKGKYQVIYADPPWEYDREIGQGVAIDQYTTLPLEEIKKMPIINIASEDSILFLWATFPKIKEALETIEAWGFEYKTVAFTWIKTNKNNDKPFFGIGSYFKSNAEVCLLAIKGKPHPLVKDNSLSSVIISPLEEHSQKPAEARVRIEKLLGNVKRIELFAREKVKGWDSWGNEI